MYSYCKKYRKQTQGLKKIKKVNSEDIILSFVDAEHKTLSCLYSLYLE